MEWLIVHCDGDREVYLNGTGVGRTNVMLAVSGGSFDLTVEGLPGTKRIEIGNTTDEFPMEVDLR